MANLTVSSFVDSFLQSTDKFGAQSILGLPYIIPSVVADARTTFDFATTSGTKNITSATAAFVSGDVGKSVGIEGAGSGGLPLLTTITSITNGTTAVVAVNAGSSVSEKRGTIGTDNTAAIQAAITAAASGGRIYIPSGQYFLAGSLDGTTNSQLVLPSRNLSSAAEYGFEFFGSNRPAPNLNWTSDNEPLSTGGTVLISMQSGTNPGIFGCVAPMGATWAFSAIRVSFTNLTFRTYNNPSIIPISCAQVGQLDVEHVLIDNGNILSAVAGPSNGSCGIIGPGSGNWTISNIRDVDVIGYNIGTRTSEHTDMEQVRTWLCSVAFQFTDSYHAQRAGKLLSVGCSTVLQIANIYSSGRPRFVINELCMEHTLQGDWRETTLDIDDASNLGNGLINYATVQSNIGITSALVLNGASKITINDLSGIGSGVKMQSLVAATISQSDNTAIATWTDTVSGWNLAQATGGSQPTYHTSGPNSKPYITFNGSSSFMTGTVSIGAVALTMFTVLRMNVSGGNSQRIIALAASGQNEYDNKSGLAFGRSGGATSTNLDCYKNNAEVVQIAALPAVWHVTCTKFDGAFASMSVDGGAFTSAANTNTFSAISMYLGRNISSSAAFFYGDLAENSIWLGTMSSSAIAAEIARLQTLYGI